MRAIMRFSIPVRLSVIALLSSFFASGCSKHEELAALENRIEERNLEAEALQEKLAELKTAKVELGYKLQKDRELSTRLAREVERVQPSIDFMSDLIAGVDFYDAKLEAWREATRASLVGMTIKNLTLVDGRTLNSVTIKKVEDEEVTFTLSDGANLTVPCSELPKPFLKRIAHESTILEEAESL